MCSSCFSLVLRLSHQNYLQFVKIEPPLRFAPYHLVSRARLQRFGDPPFKDNRFEALICPRSIWKKKSEVFTWPSGKAAGFGPVTRRFESVRPVPSKMVRSFARQNQKGISGRIVTIEYDPNRNAYKTCISPRQPSRT